MYVIYEYNIYFNLVYLLYYCIHVAMGKLYKLSFKFIHCLRYYINVPILDLASCHVHRTFCVRGTVYYTSASVLV